MRGHALAGGDFLGSVASAGRLGDGFFAGRRLKDSSLTLNMTPRHPVGLHVWGERTWVRCRHSRR